MWVGEEREEEIETESEGETDGGHEKKMKLFCALRSLSLSLSFFFWGSILLLRWEQKADDVPRACSSGRVDIVAARERDRREREREREKKKKKRRELFDEVFGRAPFFFFFLRSFFPAFTL